MELTTCVREIRSETASVKKNKRLTVAKRFGITMGMAHRHTANGETIHVTAIDRHRNGIAGLPFHVVLFTANGYDDCAFVATVFDVKFGVSVLERGLLAQGNIAFGENSWRGDNFEPALRLAIKAHKKRERARWHAETVKVHA